MPHLRASNICSDGQRTLVFLSPRQIVDAMMSVCRALVIIPGARRRLRRLRACQDAATLTTRQTVSCPMMRPPFKRPSSLPPFLPPFTLLGSAPNDKPNRPSSLSFSPCCRPLRTDGRTRGRNTDVEDIRHERRGVSCVSDEWARRGNGLFMCIKATTSMAKDGRADADAAGDR